MSDIDDLAIVAEVMEEELSCLLCSGEGCSAYAIANSPDTCYGTGTVPVSVRRRQEARRGAPLGRS